MSTVNLLEEYGPNTIIIIFIYSRNHMNLDVKSQVVHESEVFRHPKEKGAEWANVNLKLLEGDEQTLSEEDEDESQTIMPTQSLQSKYILTEPQKSKKLENTTIGENDDDSVSSKAKL